MFALIAKKNLNMGLNCDDEMTPDHQCEVLGNSDTGRTEQLSAKQLSLGQLVEAKYGVSIDQVTVNGKKCTPLGSPK